MGAEIIWNMQTYMEMEYIRPKRSLCNSNELAFLTFCIHNYINFQNILNMTEPPLCFTDGGGNSLLNLFPHLLPLYRQQFDPKNLTFWLITPSDQLSQIFSQFLVWFGKSGIPQPFLPVSHDAYGGVFNF